MGACLCDIPRSPESMMFRRKLLMVFALTVFLSVAAVAWLVSAVTRRAFDRSEDERTAALRHAVSARIQPPGRAMWRGGWRRLRRQKWRSRMALALNRAWRMRGHILNWRRHGAENNRLDFLGVCAKAMARIVSSAQWPAKFGYAGRRCRQLCRVADQGAFLKQEELQDGTALGLFAVRATRAGERPVYVIGGRRLDKTFLSGIDMPAGMRVLLYQNRGERFAAELLVDPCVRLRGERASGGKARASGRCRAGVQRGDAEAGALVGGFGGG